MLYLLTIYNDQHVARYAQKSPNHPETPLQLPQTPLPKTRVSPFPSDKPLMQNPHLSLPCQCPISGSVSHTSLYDLSKIPSTTPASILNP